ncbi:uncharacterized protein C2orf72 homolog [Mixophyes fleayi]|uniref:uncharacterized protein C2orf72 homolog n=1 Tax=Mixophyes fleayi TaxID=3061075 RepID=UPI003F4D7D4A
MVIGAAMARDCTESRFREVLERFGGPQHVLLVSELWDRAGSRAVLEGFLQELFPGELAGGAGMFKNKAAPQPETSERVSQCERDGAPGHASKTPASPRPKSPKPASERTLRFGLVFFLCRPESLVLRGSRLLLREILRDVRKRMAGGCAVVGVIMQPDNNTSGTKVDGTETTAEHSPLCTDTDVSSLLSLLHSVFPLKDRGRRCSEVRAAALIPGHEETRRDIQRMASEALTAADEQRRQRPKIKSRCFSWRRRREDSEQKENHEEGTALTVLQCPNGDCAETVTEA